MPSSERRVFLLAGDYSASPALPEGLHQHTSVFFRYPRSGSGWAALRGGQSTQPLTLTDLLADASQRVLGSLADAVGGLAAAGRLVEDLLVTTMPGIAPDEIMSPALVPQTLRAVLDLDPRCRSQLVVGTSDSGAWAFASAVRQLRARAGTALVAAGQMIPPGYAAQQRIRTVLGANDQAAGLDMLAVGDLLMEVLRRNAGVSVADATAAVQGVTRAKLEAALRYPAAQRNSATAGAALAITPYFSSLDIAPACCGAAAVLVTSDLALVERVLAAAPDPRYCASRVVEVLGVGEGVANPDVTWRRSPLAALAPMREALEAAADDAGVPLHSLARGAFAVLHDAFPSIEIGFLRVLGLSLPQAVQRMASGWSNPCGGLLAMGHALGASGLVQICQTHHLLSGDRRYLPEAQPSWPEQGVEALTASVGGPISHVVASTFRGGAATAEDVLRPPVRRLRSARERGGPDTAELRRSEARRSAGRYRAALHTHAQWAGDLARLRYVEGVTTVDLRSALPGLPPAALRQAVEAAVAAVALGRSDGHEGPGGHAQHDETAQQRLSVQPREAPLDLAAVTTALFERLLALQPQVAADAGCLQLGYEQALLGAVHGRATVATALKAALHVPVALVVTPPDHNAPTDRRRVGQTRAVVPLGPSAVAAGPGLPFLLVSDAGLGELPPLPTPLEAWLPPWEATARWPDDGPLGDAAALLGERELLAPRAHVGRSLGHVAALELRAQPAEAAPSAARLAGLLWELRRAQAWFGRGSSSVGCSGLGVRLTAVTTPEQGDQLLGDAVLAAFELLAAAGGQLELAIAFGEASEACVDDDGHVVLTPALPAQADLLASRWRGRAALVVYTSRCASPDHAAALAALGLHAVDEHTWTLGAHREA